MASLYESSIKARRIILFVLIGLIIVLIIDTLVQFNNEPIINTEAGRFYMLVDRKFGDIPAPAFEGMDYSSSATFALQSIHRQYPDVAYVYQIRVPREKLLSFDNAKDKVELLGFSRDAFTDLGDNNFQWKKDNDTKTLTYNRITQRWDLDTLFYQNEDALKTKRLLDNAFEYKSRVSNFISQMDFGTLGINISNDDNIEINYASLGIDGVFLDVDKAEEGEFIVATAYRKLRFADIKPPALLPQVEDKSLIPDPLDATVYSSDPRYGQITVIGTNDFSDYKTELFQLDFTNFEYGDKGSYLIITPDEAWDNVQNGKGKLTFLNRQNGNFLATENNLEVKEFIANAIETELAYWEPETYNGYVYPIYVFTGRAELTDGRQATFKFYVDAIKRAD